MKHGWIAPEDEAGAADDADGPDLSLVGVGQERNDVRVVYGVHAALRARADVRRTAFVQRERHVMGVVVVHEALGATLRVEAP